MDSFDKYLELVPQQYKNSPNLLHLLRTVNAEVSDVKNMLSELSVLTSIDDATGVQLDNIGAWKGKPRKSGESDAAYRVRLKSLTGTKIPTFKAVREAAMELNGTPWALVCPDWPAGMYIVTEAPGTELKLNLDNLAAAGESCLLGSFLTDEDDDLILDEDGNPIVIDYVHVENEERWNAPASLKLANGGYIRLASGGFIELVGQTGGGDNVTVSIGTFSNGSVSYEAYDEENDEYETTDNVTSKVLPKGCTLYVYGEDEDYYGDIDVYDGDDFIGYFTVEADDGYSFAGWGTVPETLTGNVTITPTFEADEEEEVTTGSVTINGKEYPTVVINGKEWMAENLAIPSSLSIYYEGVGNHWVEDDGYTMVNEADWETTDGSTPLITQFHNKAIADKFGYMYNYGSILAEFGEAARLYPGIDFGFGTVTDIKSMIPEGWRLPNEDDFKALLGENSASEIVDLDTALLRESDDYSWHCDADGSKLFNAVPSSYVTRKVWVDGRSKLANPFVENNALYVGSNVSDLVLLGAAKKVAVSDMPSQMTSAGVTDDIVITAARFMSTNESEDDVHAQAIVYTGTVFGCTPTDSNLYVNDKLPLTSDKVNVMLHAAVRLVRDAQ